MNLLGKKCLPLRLSLILLIGVPLFSMADTNSDFTNDLSYAKGLSGKSTAALQNFDPNAQFKGYTDNPTQTKYFSGVTQKSDNGLKTDGAKSLVNTDVGRSELHQFVDGKKYHLDLHSKMIQQGQFIESDSDDIARGKSDQYVDCQHPKNNPDGIVCGGNFYCMDSHCSQHTPIQSQDFGSSSAQLAAVSSGANDVKKQNQKKEDKNPMIFVGHAMNCDDDALGFSNCCRDKGWGQDIHLAHCSGEEKTLGKNKMNGLTVYVGKYCSHRTHIGHICLQHRKVYCSFGSKLAKIVQNQGRNGQLHINFGDVGGHHSNPNCRGISSNEMSKIDFSKIDFSAVYQDIKNNTNFPNNSDVDSDIQKEINEFYHHGQSHDKNSN